MKQDVRKLVGICGLYCGTCPLYLAFQENDIKELEKISQERNIPIEDIHCDGCLSNQVISLCVNCRAGFRQCAEEKRVTWCFECSEFPCQRLRDFTNDHIVDGISHHAHVIDDLQYMKTNGVEKWVEQQERAGLCPHCGKRLYWYTRVCPNCQARIR